MKMEQHKRHEEIVARAFCRGRAEAVEWMEGRERAREMLSLELERMRSISGD